MKQVSYKENANTSLWGKFLETQETLINDACQNYHFQKVCQLMQRISHNRKQ